jgi:hypothetical protein
MTPPITIPIGEFFIRNPVPYFQPPTQNPPLKFSNFSNGIPTRGGCSPFHGSGRPLGWGSGPLKRGGGPLGEGGPPGGGGFPSGEGPLGGGGGGFLIGGGTRVPFGAL